MQMNNIYKREKTLKKMKKEKCTQKKCPTIKWEKNAKKCIVECNQH